VSVSSGLVQSSRLSLTGVRPACELVKSSKSDERLVKLTYRSGVGGSSVPMGTVRILTTTHQEGWKVSHSLKMSERKNDDRCLETHTSLHLFLQAILFLVCFLGITTGNLRAS